MKIGLLVGSLRKDSYNKKVAEIVKDIINESEEAKIIDLSEIPFYNEDLDGDNEIDAFKNIREELRSYDGYIFFQPEYNRSVTPILKNIVDIGSRGPKGNLWANKPGAIFAASMGSSGGQSGALALRDTFIYPNLILMNQPELYLSNVHTLFDEDGNLVEDTKKFLDQATGAFLRFAKKTIG